tara:strand:- start:1312 stop:1962 length:651 start_codon:yes stop_codon:yes gene_type:complete
MEGECVVPSDKVVVGLCGYGEAGKDTAAKGLLDQGWQRVSFADPVRKMAMLINPIIPGGNLIRLRELVEGFGWTDAKKMFPEVRRLLQVIGTEAVRGMFGDDVWVELALKTINATNKNVVITDCRFPNEFAMVREIGYLIRVDRPGIDPVNGHVSESYIAEAEVDRVVVNDKDEEAIQCLLCDTIIDLVDKGGLTYQLTEHGMEATKKVPPSQNTL